MTDVLSHIQTFLSRPDLPAWLQTFAAIVALIISVWAAWRVGASDRRRDRLQARGMAVAIYPELLKLEITIEDTRQNLHEVKAQAGKLVGQSVAASVQVGGYIETPPMLDRNVDKLFLLGERAGPACLQLVGMLQQYNALVEAIAVRIVVMNATQWAEAVQHLEEHLTLLTGVVAKCAAKVQPIHDAVRG
jgi:hypothetical protein